MFNIFKKLFGTSKHKRGRKPRSISREYLNYCRNPMELWVIETRLNNNTDQEAADVIGIDRSNVTRTINRVGTRYNEAHLKETTIEEDPKLPFAIFETFLLLCKQDYIYYEDITHEHRDIAEFLGVSKELVFNSTSMIVGFLSQRYPEHRKMISWYLSGVSDGVIMKTKKIKYGPKGFRSKPATARNIYDALQR